VRFPHRCGRDGGAEVEDRVGKIERCLKGGLRLVVKSASAGDLLAFDARERSRGQGRIEFAASDSKCTRLGSCVFPSDTSLGIVPFGKIDQLGQ